MSKEPAPLLSKNNHYKDSWVDDIVKNKMRPYDITKTCMLASGENFGISDVIKTAQERIVAYEYFIGKLIQMFDSIPMPLIMHNKDFHITRANTAYLKLVEKECDEVIGKYYGEIFPLDDANPPKCVCKLPRQVGYKEKNYKIYSFPMEDPKLGCYQASMHLFEEVTSQVEAERLLKKAELNLSESLVKTIQAMAQTLEQRDPYTSGHQKRVSQLAGAIAKEIGLPKEKILAIQLGGLIHDIGKVHVPSDILTKTGKLREEEFSLIKLHPEIGCEIIQGIKFPWPIKEIILQHHERLDGSGYPKGLKDREIVIEAKIMAIADVVEAMSSHRPYRPSLGIDAALEEIEKNKGKLYDPKAVDACIKLFKEKNFTFEKI